ncbi:MAG: flagellar hook-basal body complex protein FliE [Planctomycetes bacterium]|nr:flagellar hook-basal body complex protein FliE [Planctomycetota bacterium]
MPDPIQLAGVLPPGGVAGVPGPAAAPATAPGRDFKSILVESLEEVNRLQHEADTGVKRLLTGETDNVAEVFAAVNKAGIAFDLLMEVRNKLTDAYEEIKQMRV